MQVQRVDVAQISGAVTCHVTVISQGHNSPLDRRSLPLGDPTLSPLATVPLSQLFRLLSLPCKGGLYLHAMPGRGEPVATSLREVARLRITRVVCLAMRHEIEDTSLAYATAIHSHRDWHFDLLPVPDYGVAQDSAAFVAKVQQVVVLLDGGYSVLVHCAAGIGRTGCFAIAVLLLKGYSLEAATMHVKAHGSWPESIAQIGFLEAVSVQLLSTKLIEAGR